MFDKLKTVYEACLYKVSVLGTKILTKTMTHWLEFRGLDPNSPTDKNKNKILESIFGDKQSPGIYSEDYVNHPIIQKMKDDSKRRTQELLSNGQVGIIKKQGIKEQVAHYVKHSDKKSIKDLADTLNGKYNLEPKRSIIFNDKLSLMKEIDQFTNKNPDTFTPEAGQTLTAQLDELEHLLNATEEKVLEKSEKKPSRKPAKKKAKKPVKKPVKKNKKK